MPLTESEELELLELEKARSGGQAPAPMAQSNTLSPESSQFGSEHPILHTVGRAARTGLSGLSSLADLGLLVPKTAALGLGLGAEKMGATGFGQSLQRLGATPTMADTSNMIVDQATGNRLQDRNNIDKVGTFIGQMIASAVPFSQSPKALSAVAGNTPPSAGTALTALLDPQTALNQLPSVQATQVPKVMPLLDQKQVASSAYQKAKEYGGLLKPEATDNFLDNISKEILPQTKAGRTLAGKDTPIATIMARLEELRGNPLSLDEVQEMDEILGDAIDAEFGIKGLSGQGKKILEVQNAFRDMVENADETMVAGTKEGFDALKQARAEWSKYMKMKDIDRIITRAEMSDQPANAIRSGFKTLYNNEKRMRGFSKEEAKLIKQAATDNLPMEVLRGLASRLTGIVSGATHGPIGFAAGKGIEMGARGLRERMATQKTDALMNMISGYKPPQAQNILTNQGALAALAGANTAGQQMLPKPPLQITVKRPPD